MTESSNLFFAEDKEDGSPQLNMVDDDLDDNDRDDTLDDYITGEQKQEENEDKFKTGEQVLQQDEEDMGMTLKAAAAFNFHEQGADDVEFDPNSIFDQPNHDDKKIKIHDEL